jgi:predicted TIM-barrel fold metal-dependent hydrolase
MPSKIPMIDTHVHMWDQKHPELRWDWLSKDAVHPILGNIDAIKMVGFKIDDLWSEARFSNLEAFVHVQAAIGSPDPVTETKWLTEMADGTNIPLRALGDCSLNHTDAIKTLERHGEFRIFAGVRDFNAEPLLASGGVSTQYNNSLKYLAERNWVFDLDCEWPNMDAALRLAREHPNLKIVLQHIGFPRRRDDEYFNNWRAALKRLSEAENVVCKISGIGMTDPRFTKESLRKWVETCLETFGPAKCVMGSNWPVDRLFSSYDVIVGFMREYISSLSDGEQRLILRENAHRIYNFG